jgi:succinoglycan biosynthesis protein ExoA
MACVMPFLDEAASLPAVLATLSEQTLDPARIYLVAVDDGSTDGSAAIVAAWLAAGPVRGTLIGAAVKSIPYALNAGLAHVDADDVVVRLDAHTLYDPHYLETIDDAFATLEDDVWCVGGAPTPGPATGYLRRLGEALYANPMGLGPADFRRSSNPDEIRRVSTVYLGAWRPGVLQRLGGFDERWEANEDCELTERIAAAGGATARIPVRCGRMSTRGPVATIRQWTRYGYWRAQTFKHYPRAIRARHVAVPVAFLAALGLLVSSARRFLVPLYVLYALATIRFRRRGESTAVTTGSLVFFPLVHCGYAIGLIAGALSTPRSLRETRSNHAAGR